MQQQMSFLDTSYGRTSPELSVPTKVRTSEKSSKRSPALKTVLPMFLDLRAGSGNLAGRSWETDSLSLGAPSTRNFGESPSVVEESTLSQILEENVDPKYYLSATACKGVLRRAVNRGKELPTLLKIALCLQGKLTADEIRGMGLSHGSELIPYDGGTKVYDARGNGDGEIVPTLTGDHEDRITDYTAVVCVYDGSQITQKNNRSNPRLGDPSCTITESGAEREYAVICYIDYAAFNQGVNAKYDFGVDNKTAFTLTGKGQGAVCFAIGNGQADQLGLHEKAGALNCMHHEQAIVYCIATQQGGAEIAENKSPTVTAAAGMSGNNQPWICFVGINGDKAGTLDASYYKGCGARDLACAVAERRVIYVYVRRLTPTECARLQGMPDWWCADIPHADAPEYKMWGNGMALPNILYVMEGIAEQEKEERNGN